METRTVTKTIPVKTNITEMEHKVDRLNEIIEEARTLIQELASMDIKLELDIDSITKEINERTNTSGKCPLIL